MATPPFVPLMTLSVQEDKSGRVVDFVVDASGLHDVPYSQVFMPARPWPAASAVPAWPAAVTLTSVTLQLEEAGEAIPLRMPVTPTGLGADNDYSVDRVPIRLFAPEEETAQIGIEYARVQGVAEPCPFRVRFRHGSMALFDADAKATIATLVLAAEKVTARENVASAKRKRAAYECALDALEETSAKRACAEPIAVIKKECEAWNEILQTAEAKVAELEAV